MGKDFDKHRGGRVQWVAWLAERLAEARRVVRPGHYALIWALPRSSHWTGCAIEDSGWTIIDRISHIFGQGFPKSKARLKPAVEDWWLCRAPGGGKVRELGIDQCRIAGVVNNPSSVRARRHFDPHSQRDDALLVEAPDPHPAGRYPPNLVLQHHPDCAPAGTRRVKGHKGYPNGPGGSSCQFSQKGTPTTRTEAWAGHADPDGTEEVAAWLCVDGCPVKALDEMAGERTSGKGYPGQGSGELVTSNTYGSSRRSAISTCYADSGSNVSRFFPTFAVEAADFVPFGYHPKASKRDRGEGNTHPCVKSQSMMKWLCKLVTPPGGTVLDPFAGSGTTLLAAHAEGFAAIGMESDPDYYAIASKRLAGRAGSLPLFP